MNNNIVISAERWSDLLTHYCEGKEITEGVGTIVKNRGRSFIHLNGKRLKAADILAISQEKTLENPNGDVVLKLLQAIELFIQKRERVQEEKLQPQTKTFAARVSRIALNYPTLAKILSVITFGLFSHLCKQGNAIYSRLERSQANINNFKSLIETLKASKPGPTSTFFPKEIDEIIVDYMDYDDKKVAQGWFPLKVAIKNNFNRMRFKVVEEYQKKLLPLLDPQLFKEEIKELKLLKKYLLEKYGHCRPGCDCPNPFLIPTTSEDWIRKLVASKIVSLFNLKNTTWYQSGTRLAGYPQTLPPEAKWLPLANNKTFVLILLKDCLNLYPQLNNDLKHDREIIHAALSTSGWAFQHIPEDIKSSQVFVIESLKNYSIFEYLPQEYRNNPLIAKTAVLKNYQNLAHAPILQGDRAFMEELIKNQAWAINSASPAIKQDPKMIKLAMATNGRLLEDYPQYNDNKEFVLLAVKNSGYNLSSASTRLKDDYDVVLAAVSNWGLALGEASERLKKDLTIVSTAVAKHGNALNFVPQFLNHRELVLSAAKSWGRILETCSEDLRKDDEIFFTSVQQDGMVLHFGTPEQKNNRRMVLAAVRQNGLALGSASDDLKRDREVVLAAIEQNEDAYDYSLIRDDQAMACQVLEINGMKLNLVANHLKDDEKTVLTAVKQNGLALKFASERLKNDKKIVLAALKEQSLAYEFVPDSLKQDKNIIDLIS